MAAPRLSCAHAPEDFVMVTDPLQQDRVEVVSTQVIGRYGTVWRLSKEFYVRSIYSPAHVVHPSTRFEICNDPL
jgi:hypothetical protein